MTLQEWFREPDTPSEHSPVGELMVKVLAKYPQLTFEEARAEANRLLADAAGKRNYRMPEVLTPEEQAARSAAIRERVRKAPKRPKSGHGQTRTPKGGGI